MIEKEYGKCFGVCDVCGEVTPKFIEWENCTQYMRRNNWRATKNRSTGEWENICPECAKLAR